VTSKYAGRRELDAEELDARRQTPNVRAEVQRVHLPSNSKNESHSPLSQLAVSSGVWRLASGVSDSGVPPRSDRTTPLASGVWRLASQIPASLRDPIALLLWRLASGVWRLRFWRPFAIRRRLFGLRDP
jgi:hypothetical protein